MSSVNNTSNTYTLTAKERRPTIWLRKNGEGQLIRHEETQEERMQHVVPPAGEYQLKLLGIAEPFELEGQYGVQTKTQLELEIQNGKGKGKVCTLMLNWTIGPNSNLGKVWQGATSKDVEKGQDYEITDLIGGEFKALLYPSDETWDDGKPKGTRCTWDSIKPVSATTDGSDDDTWA